MSAANTNEGRRKTQKPVLAPDALETRSMMTGGIGSTFALIPGEVAAAGGSQVVTVKLESDHFTLPKHKLLLGVDVAAATNDSKVAPKIVSVSPSGTVGTTAKGGAAKHHPSGPIMRVGNNRAILTPVSLNAKQPTQPASYDITVQAQNKTSGKFLTGFYLPGDANGDGKVEKADLALIKKAIGGISGQNDKLYSFDADTNRDGRIGWNDYQLAQRNLGAKVTISPILSANLDGASDTGAKDRVTNEQIVHFTGDASPGASITFAEVNAKSQPKTVTAGSDGKYTINVGLGAGQNTFQVTSTDAFGQTISGKISPVTYVTFPLPADPNAKTS